MEVEKAISGLKEQIDIFSHKCGLLLGKGSKVAVHYDTADGIYRSIYYSWMEENIWLYKGAAGNAQLTDGKCRTYYMEGWLNGAYLGYSQIRPGIMRFEYTSLNDGLQSIRHHEIHDKHYNVVAHNNYDIVERIIRRGVNERLQVRIGQLMANM